VPRPRVDVCRRREDFLAREGFALEETFEIEEFLGDELILQVGEPGLVESVDFEEQEFFGFFREGGYPSVFVKGTGGGSGGVF